MTPDTARAAETAVSRPVRRTQAERVERTRGALVAAGRRLFGTHGFAVVTLDQIVSEAGLTRGAFYHHFRDKADLFRAVYEEVEVQAVDEIARVLAEVTDTSNDIRKAVVAYLDLVERREIRQIALLDAPVALGWQDWREIESRFSLGVMVSRLETALGEGIELAASPEMLSSLVLSAANEAALRIATSDEPLRARRDAEQALIAILGGLISDPRS